MVEKLRVLDLFSGIGGFSLGLERTGGFSTVAFCEIEPFPRKVLAKHWPKVPIFDDVRTLEYDGTVDVITGGYPCQPFSTAGKRQGQADDRHLWPAMFSLIKNHRPSWVIGENVVGHISMGLDEVLSDLESAGYAADALDIPSCAVGAPHIRHRVWILAYAESAGERREVGNIREADGRPDGELLFQPDGTGPIPANSDSEGLSVPLRSQLRRLRGQETSPQGSKSGRGSPEAGRPWPTEPNVGRVAHGVPDRVDRLKSLGNAVVPQVVEMIGRAILEAA
jgi:DNA (cytosine-5)-methyltransferase 1